MCCSPEIHSRSNIISYSNNIENSSKLLNLILFADDCTIYACDSNANLIQTVKDELARAARCLKASKLTLNFPWTTTKVLGIVVEKHSWIGKNVHPVSIWPASSLTNLHWYLYTTLSFTPLWYSAKTHGVPPVQLPSSHWIECNRTIYEYNAMRTIVGLRRRDHTIETFCVCVC